MNDRPSAFILSSVHVIRRNGKAVPCCGYCDAELGDDAGDWKANAVQREVALADVPGGSFETGFPGVILRHFYCSSCASVLDTEIAEPGEPFLKDHLT